MNDYLSLAIIAALEAGRAIMDVYTDPSADFGIEHKADNSPLTRADKIAHTCIMRHLEPTGIPVLSEEGAHLPYETERCHWRRLWIVDPLDGTKEFIKRNGEFTVNIALVEDGTPVAGVIYVPVKQQLYVGQSSPHPAPASQAEEWAVADWMHFTEAPAAWRIDNAESNPTATTLPTPRDAERPFRVVASRSHLSAETADFIEVLRRHHPDLEMVSSGSSLKICLVAEGQADIYPRHAPTMEWDTAAGNAIATAAGCEVVDATTEQPLTYNKADLHNPWFIVRRNA